VLPDVLGCVVDREGDYYSFVESSVVHPLRIGYESAVTSEVTIVS
jgi:hypothetical protein